jgi:hypothetical protein
MGFKVLRAWRKGLVCGLVIGAATGAAADVAAPAVNELKILTAEQRRARVKAWAAQKKLAFAPLNGVALDTSPPRLTAIRLPVSFDPTRSVSQLVVDFSLTDDLSGTEWVMIDAYGPTGQLASAVVTIPPGPTQYSGKAALDISPFAAAGEWQILAVQGYDRAGNYFYLGQRELADLGNTVVNVSNKLVDAEAPRLVSGRILTPSVSKSTPPAGTNEGTPYAAVTVKTLDNGTTAISGVFGVGLNFCLADQSACFTVGAVTDVFRQAKWTASASGSLWSNLPVGDYMLSWVTINDHARNERYYQSIAFGGETDFSTMFPDLTIHVVP